MWTQSVKKLIYICTCGKIHNKWTALRDNALTACTLGVASLAWNTWVMRYIVNRQMLLRNKQLLAALQIIFSMGVNETKTCHFVLGEKADKKRKSRYTDSLGGWNKILIELFTECNIWAWILLCISQKKLNWNKLNRIVAHKNH